MRKDVFADGHDGDAWRQEEKGEVVQKESGDGGNLFELQHLGAEQYQEQDEADDVPGKRDAHDAVENFPREADGGNDSELQKDSHDGRKCRNR